MAEQLVRVVIFEPDGTKRDVPADKVIQLELAQLAVAFKGDDETIHRVVGLPLETISTETRLVL